jgi:hypothetical protein
VSRWIIVYFLVTALLGASCKRDQAPAPSTDKVFTPSGSLADLVHNPVRSDGTIDSSFLPVMALRDTLFDFGTVQEGDMIEHEFHFTNTGTAPLLITQATSTCGCTIPEWPRETIPIDSSGFITVKFNTTNRTGSQLKEVTIFANTYPSQTIIRLRGRVIKK